MSKFTSVISLFVLIMTLTTGCSRQTYSGSKSQSLIDERIPHSDTISENNHQESPVVPNPIERPQSLLIAAANDHSLAVDNQGEVWIWGEVYKGLSILQPKKFVDIKDVKSTTGDWGYNLVLKKDGTVWGWGDNRDGQLGDGTYISRKNPVKVHGLENIEAISTSGGSALALKNDGTVWAWGDNLYGQLGSDRENGEVAALVPGLTAITKISAGSSCNVVLREDGTVYAWGYGPEIDLNTGDSISVPSKVMGIDNVEEVAAEGGSLLALKNDGTVWEWGTGGPPVKVEGLSDITSIVLEPSNNYAINKDGSVWIWNGNKNPEPIKGISNVIQVSARDDYAIAVDQNGDIWAWGDNTYGQLGDGTKENLGLPVKIQFNELESVESEYSESETYSIKSSDTRINFSLEFPSTWEGKYLVKQFDDQISIYHNALLEAPALIMNIYSTSQEEWDEFSREDGYPWSKLAEINGRVIVFDQLAEQAYPSEYAEEENEVTSMLLGIDQVKIVNLK